MARASTAFCGQAQSYADLGTAFGADLTAAEVRYLMQQGMGADADDVLWRRSKLGLRFTRQNGRGSRFMAGFIGAAARLHRKCGA